MKFVPTKRDRQIALEALEELEERARDGEEDLWPETLMFSWGYGDLHEDGDVCAFGGIVFNARESS